MEESWANEYAERCESEAKENDRCYARCMDICVKDTSQSIGFVKDLRRVVPEKFDWMCCLEDVLGGGANEGLGDQVNARLMNGSGFSLT